MLFRGTLENTRLDFTVYLGAAFYLSGGRGTRLSYWSPLPVVGLYPTDAGSPLLLRVSPVKLKLLEPTTSSNGTKQLVSLGGWWCCYGSQEDHEHGSATNRDTESGIPAFFWETLEIPSPIWTVLWGYSYAHMSIVMLLMRMKWLKCQ